MRRFAQSVDQPEHISDGLEEASRPEVTVPLVNIVKFACNACEDSITIALQCFAGFVLRALVEICPKRQSASWTKAYIDPGEVHSVWHVLQVCYQAIQPPCARPCAAACESMDTVMNTVTFGILITRSAHLGGQCLVNCPFGAIADKDRFPGNSGYQ